jgi:hypothetical protein
MPEKYRIKTEPEPIDERLKEYVDVKEILLSSKIVELAEKPLTKIGRSENSEKHVWVRDETTGKTYEVREDLLEPYEE